MRILILMYHMISKTDHPQEKRYALSPERFKRQMSYLKYMGYTPIRLDKLYEYLVNKTDGLPHKPIVITFDDGYFDNYENALPVLKELNYPATVFIVSGFVGKTTQWMRVNGFPERSLMGWHEIEETRKYGITIGSHTLSHPRLVFLGYEDTRKEIEGSKKLLEDKLGMPTEHFAYPYGDMNSSVVEMVKEAGYKTACTTRSGFNSENVSMFELRRLEIYGTDSLWQFAIKLTYGTNDGNLLLPAKYYMKRLTERFNNA